MRTGSSGSEGGHRRTSSVVTTFPASSNDHAARATLGRQGASQKAGVHRIRDRGSGRDSGAFPATGLIAHRKALEAAGIHIHKCDTDEVSIVAIGRGSHP